MVFIIPVNESEDETSVTVMRVDVGNVTMRTAKRKLRIVLTVWDIPVQFQKKMIQELCRG
jgi:hypothetical protein